ncbi:MAG TPA: guanylate kinase [Candidatus Saccharimonadales bacterium]|nr:guanylate kinase [Candidatus Saccharimonadales bacterium]
MNKPRTWNDRAQRGSSRKKTSAAKAAPVPDRRADTAPPLAGPLLVVISAPSGTGKTTLCEQTLRTRATTTRAVTCTTRPPRPGEKDGVDYFFLEAAAFLKRVQAGNFLEHATVYGNSYGTLKSEVLGKLRAGKEVLLNVDVQGAAAIRAHAAADPELGRALVMVFLAPMSLQALEQRLRKRGQDSSAVIAKRLSVAQRELAQWKNFDYLVVSSSIEEDVRRLAAILDAEQMRQVRVELPGYQNSRPQPRPHAL